MTSNPLIAIAVLLLTGGVAWHFMNLKPPRHEAVALDPSSSVEANCDGLRASVLRIIKESPGIGRGSTLSFLEMGKSVYDPTPKLRFSVAIPEKPVKVFGSNPEEHKRKLEELAGQVKTACEQAKPGTSSPIYELVKYSLAHLRGGEYQCGAKHPCTLLVKTDLDDDAQPELRQVIGRSIKDPAVAVPGSLARSLDNMGIEVAFCGTAEVKPRAEGSASSSLESRMRIWRELFTDPANVTFRPYCQ